MTIYAMRVAFRHEFERPAGAGRQLFRLLPATIPGIQTLERATIRIDPDPAETGEFVDFFGTRVIEIAMPAGITRFELELEAEIRRERPEQGLDISAPLDRLGAEIEGWRRIDGASPHHFLPPTPRIPLSEPIAAHARAATRGAVTVRDAVARLGGALHREMTFTPGATAVDTPPERAFLMRKGVCQDFAQIMVAGLRSLDIPAAYVSGYLRTLPPPGRPRLVGADATHAWVRAWGGAETGWIDHDPTNDCFVSGDHIEIGFGRDYDDVAPVTGVLWLEGTQTATHSVDIEESPVQP